VFVFLLADAHLEHVPEALRGHRSVVKWARIRRKKPQDLLFDSTLLYSITKKRRNLIERGRPDILHRALLTILDSELCKLGVVRGIIIHTVLGEIYCVNPRTRLPRHYFRFLGLMEKLLNEGVILTGGRRLIWRVRGLEEALKTCNVDYVIGLSRRGRSVDVRRYVEEKLRYGTVCFVVGVFPRGFFSETIRRILDDLISLGPRPYSSSYVLCRLICTCEDIVIRSNRGSKEY